MNYELSRGGSLLKPLDCFLISNHFDGVGLGLATGYEVELGFGAEILELGAGSPANIHGLDFLRVELVGRVSTITSKFYVERAKVAQTDFVASKELLAQTSHCVSQDALHSTLRER